MKALYSIYKKIIHLQILEEQRFKQTQKISEVIIPIPNHLQLFSNSIQSRIDFSSIDLNYSGQIGITIGWNTIKYKIETNTNKNSAIQKYRVLHKKNQILQNWYNEHLLDPMDPEINSLVEKLENGSLSSDYQQKDKQPNKHVIILNEDSTTFCTKEEFDNNQRLKMLRARFRNELMINKKKVIPHSAREIEKISINNNDDFKMFEEFNWMDPIDVHRHKGRRYLKYIYCIIGNHVEKTRDYFDSQDFLAGDTPPTFRYTIYCIVKSI